MKSKHPLVDTVWLLLGAGFIVILDQLSKQWIRDNLAIGEVFHPELWITSHVRILHWTNTGSAFGLFPNMGSVLTVMAFLVSAAIIFYFPRVPRQDWILRLAMTLQLGGAVGNLVDRLMQGHVTDFISVGNFPVFNLADASISVGVAILILDVYLKERQEKTDPDQQEPAAPVSSSDLDSHTTSFDS